MMLSQGMALLLFLSTLLLLIGCAELLYRRFGLAAELSRKFLHVSGGLVCLLLPSFFSSHLWVLALAALAFGLLAFTYYKRLLAAVHKTKRKSIGSVIFPIPVYCCFAWAELADNFLFFYLPVALLTISDTAAEIAGNRWGQNSRQFFNGQKTMAGSLAFFITAIPVCIVCCWFFTGSKPLLLIAISLVLALAASLAELITLRGWDNLSMPLFVNTILYLLLK